MNGAMVGTALLLAATSAACWVSDGSIDFGSTTTSTAEDGTHQFGATTDGEMTWWVVSVTDVAKTPDWVPGEEPPLSLAQAVQLAKRDVPKYTKTPDAYRLDSVELFPIGQHRNNGRKWIYLATFEREYAHGGQRFDARGTLTIPVLLNGRVIQGVKE